MFSVQPRRFSVSDEELGGVGVGASVSHGEEVGLGEVDVEVLIGEVFAVDGVAALAVAGGDVTALGHEVVDDAVEGGAFVGHRFAAGAGDGVGTIAELDKVLDGFGGGLTEHTEDNTTFRLSLDRDVEVDLFSDWGQSVLNFCEVSTKAN